MKNFKFLLITNLFFISFFAASAQKQFYVIPKVGINLSTITNVDSDWKYGLNIGCGVEWNAIPKFAIESGLYFSQLGTKNLIEANDARRKNIKLNYIQLPLIAKYYFHEGFNVFIGPQVGYRVGYSHTPYIDIVTFDEKDFNFDAIGGVGYQFNFGLLLSASYIIGFTNLDYCLHPNMEDSPMKYERSNNRNSTFQFNIGWRF